MNTLKIRQCLETLEIDEDLIGEFLRLLNILRLKSSNGHRPDVARLKELLMDAVLLDYSNTEDVCSTLECALDEQIMKAQASLKKLQ